MSRAAKITLLIRASLLVLTLTVSVLVFGPFGGDEEIVGLTDKEAHALAFYALMSIAVLAVPRLRKTDMALVCLAFGGAIEVIQPFVGRDGNIADWLADATGVCLAYAPMAIQSFLSWMNEASLTPARSRHRRRRGDKGATIPPVHTTGALTFDQLLRALKD